MLKYVAAVILIILITKLWMIIAEWIGRRLGLDRLIQHLINR